MRPKDVWTYDCDEHEIFQRIITRTLRASSLEDQFSFGTAHVDTVEECTARQLALHTLRGRNYLELGLGQLFRQQVYPIVRQEMVKTTVNIVTANDDLTRFCAKLGVMASSSEDRGFDVVLAFLMDALNGDLLQSIRDFASTLPETVGVDPLPTDRVQKLLERLREFTDNEVPPPKIMSELRPLLAPCSLIPSRRNHPKLSDFLQAVADKALVDEGQLVSRLPEVKDLGWNLVWSSVAKRHAHGAIGPLVLKAFVGDMILDYLMQHPAVHKDVYHEILDVATSDHTLIMLIFRRGIYQEVGDCPYDGLEACSDTFYPVLCFKIYFAILQRISQKEHCTVKNVIKNVFEPLVDSLIMGYTEYEAEAPPEAPLSPQRQSMLPISFLTVFNCQLFQLSVPYRRQQLVPRQAKPVVRAQRISTLAVSDERPSPRSSVLVGLSDP
ncbi:hypothetical protein C8R43DRAFT_943528 [Mycena crocata]|nr:hypothetical protein C8R43DRAFT_943528 [Mycena crocata]